MQATLKEIQKAKAVAEMDPGHDVQTRRVKLGHIRQAKEKLETLYMEYRREIQNNSVFIVALGSSAKSFADKAKKDYQCFSYEADGLYKDLLSKVSPKVYLNQLGSRSFFEHLSAKFEERAMEIDIVGYPPLYFDAKYKKQINSKEEALDMTKRAINEKIGGEVAGLDAIEKAAIEAVNSEFEGQVIPIVLYTEDEKLAEEVLAGLPRINKNVFLVTAGKDIAENLQNKSISSMVKVTKESVEKTLIKIKENVL